MVPKKPRLKMLTVDEANSLLPWIKECLLELRKLREQLLRLQAQVEIEEMTGKDANDLLTLSAKQAVTTLMASMQEKARQVENILKEMQEMGVHLKNIETGLVDFFSLRDDDVVLLCWKDGEPAVQHWHNLEDGFQGRQPL